MVACPPCLNQHPPLWADVDRIGDYLILVVAFLLERSQSSSDQTVEVKDAVALDDQVVLWLHFEEHQSVYGLKVEGTIDRNEH